MKQTIVTFLAVYGVIAGATSCGPGSNSAPVQLPAQYQQIERLARPAIKEATESFARHDTTNRSTPYATPYSSQVLYQDIGSFVTTVGGRAAVNASTLQAILIPDEIAVDLSQSTTTAAYLGVETGGATGSKYGGRGLSDDVIDIDLGAIFGKTLSALGLVPDDGKASPCLATDNVPSQAVPDHVSTTFPYVGTPH